MSRARFANEPEAAVAPQDTWLSRYLQSLRFALHVITHPFDGFWDLIHEKRGTIAAANTFLFLFLLTRVLKLICTNFQFISAPIQHINLFEEAASLLLPFLVLCVANWAMTTLFDGKGRFKDIYIAMCYALVPYILIQFPMILVSRMITLLLASESRMRDTAVARPSPMAVPFSSTNPIWMPPSRSTRTLRSPVNGQSV